MTIKHLPDKTAYVKATHHTGKGLKGAYEVTYKIDGVRCLRDSDDNPVSRNGKPLYNVDHLEFTDAEIFRKDWNTSVSLVRSKAPKFVCQSDVYQLAPGQLDGRLIPRIILIDPTYEECLTEMQKALDKGYEGIVLRLMPHSGLRLNKGKPKWIKVVPEITADVRVTGYTMSKARKGWIQNFQTNHGNISATSFTEEELIEIAFKGAPYYTGRIMEIGYREKTINGKARFAKFKHWRFDKDEESFT